MAATVCGPFPAISSLSSSRTVERPRRATLLASSPSFFRPNVTSNKNIRFSSLRVSHKADSVVLKQRALEDDKSEVPLTESEPSFSSSQENYGTNPSLTEGTIDLKLPRRSLMVHFTCNACGERTQRLVNRLAYERGTVFVQCAGCLQHHKLVDNLGLVVEYDLREDMGTDSKVDQV